MAMNGFKKHRLIAGLTQEQVAENLGVSQGTVCQWETGRTMPRISLLPFIAKLYGCNLEDLIGTTN